MTNSTNNTAATQIARRRTFDGVTVVLWSDGVITGRLGLKLPGVSIRKQKDASLALRAGWLLLGECELWESGDMGALYAACKHVAKGSGLPGDVRARMRTPKGPAPKWETISVDRDGRTTERVWRLPRILGHGDAAVFFKSGVYSLWRVVRGVAEPTGIDWTRVSDMREWLSEPSQLATPSEPL